MNRLLVLIASIAVSACSTVITDQKPNNINGFAEVDVASSTGKPDLTVYKVSAHDRMALEDYEDQANKPQKLYLKTGTYSLVLNCDRDINLPDGRVIHSVLTDVSPGFDITVEAGNKYSLGCEPTGQSDGYYLHKQQSL